MNPLKYILTSLIMMLSAPGIFATQFFVATNGSDSNTGTIDSPYKTITKVLSLSGTIFKAGDTLYVRGGTYTYTTTINIAKYGTADAVYHIFAYPGERPILDFSTMAYNSSNRGITLKGQYCYIKGFDIKGAGDNGINISGSNNIIENCAFYENRDSGMQLNSAASNNKVINCDSYYNADPDNYGDADGFSCKMDVGSGNYFYGCRSWMNVDDGWDGYLRGADSVSTTIENCWAFHNGYLKNGVDGGANANGQGFKMGGSDDKKLQHNFKLTNCLSFMNKANGYDQNSNMGSMILYNCTSYSNKGQSFYLSKDVAAGQVMVVKNCVALGGKMTMIASVQQLTNSWLTGSGATDTDFVNIDTTGLGGATAPRKDDGSLPDITFMHLAKNSKMIDAGTDLGLPFNGKAPDLGCFETDYLNDVKEGERGKGIMGYNLLQNYPNPFNPTTTIKYELNKQGYVKIKVYNIQGRQVAALVNSIKSAGEHSVKWEAAGQSSGIYFCQLSVDGLTVVKKMILAK